MNKNLFSILILSFVLSACARGPVSLRFGGDESSGLSEKPAGENKTGENNGEAVVGFDLVFTKVFEKNCKECHSRTEFPLSTYNDYRMKADKIMEQVVRLRRMPFGQPLSEEQIALVKAWVEGGAQEKSTEAVTPEPIEPTEPIVGTKVTYEDLKVSFLNNSCVGCHSGTRRARDLTTYETVKKNALDIFEAVVFEQSMPPGPDHATGDANPNRLSTEQKDLLYKWIRDGMIEK